MSQVIRKYNSGGQTDKPKLLSVKGLGDFNQDDLIKRGYRDVDEYASSKGLGNTAAADFRNAVQYMLEGISNGTMTMDAMGNFQDATGQKSSTGELDRKKFLGIKTGVKNTENNAYGLAADYLYNIIKGSPQYKQPEVKKERFNANKLMEDAISREWYGGNAIDYNNWFRNRTEQDRNALMGRIWDSADYNQIFQSHDWSGTNIKSAEDLAALGRAYGAAITNNKLDNNDYNTFAALGGTGLDKFLKEAPVQTEPTPEQSGMKAWEAEAEAAGATTPEAKSAYIQRKQREEADRNAAIVRANEEDIYNRERDAFFNDYATKNPFKGTVSGYVASKTSYNPENVLQYIDTTHKGVINDYLKSALDPRYFRGQLSHQNEQGQDNLREHLANNLDLAINTGKLPKIDDETYAIPGTYNYDNWSLITYNPVSRQYKETSMLANDALKKIAYAEYDRRKKTPTNKEGGIIKLQYGGFVEDDSAYNAYREQFAKKKEEKKQQIQAKAKATDRTPEQVEAGERKPMADGQDWEYEDYARLVSAGADVGSMIASFVPGYGTAASAALGVGSTIGNFTADLADESVGVGSAFLNAGAGLGMDLVGLIPGLGAAGKGSKIVKNLLKVAPKLITIWSASTSFAPAMQAFNKLKDKGAKEMTVGDWKALANGLTAAAGATRWGASAARNKRLTNQHGLPYRTVTTKSGKQVSMGEDQFQQMRRATGIEEQNKVLQSVAEGEELPTTFKNWYSLKRVTQGTPSVSKGVDFSTMDLRRATSDGKVLEPHPLSNEGIWEYMVNNSWGKSFKKPDIGKNWDYRPYKHETNNAPASEWDTFKSDLESKAKTRIKKKQYEQALAEQDKKDLRKIRTATTAKNKREQYSNSMADDAIALKYWRKRYPKRTAGLSDNDLLDLIEQQKVASRDPQGRLKFDAGGVVQFLQDGKTVGRIKAKDMSNWNRAQALTNYDWGADFDRWASSHDSPDDVVDSYITSFNGGEDIYDQLTSKTGDYFGGKYNYSVQDPLAKHRQVTFRGTNQGFDDLIRKGIVGYGTTEGNSGFDVYAGDRTGNRTLGRGMSPEDVARFNKQLATRGMELYDKGNGAYRLRRLEQKPVELPEVVVTADTPKTPATTNPSAIKRAAPKKGKGFNLGVMPEDVIALGRMVGGLAANNRAAKLYKEGLKPTLLDTFENTVPLQGNFQATTNAEQQAGNLESVAARPRTSDASLQLAGELEASGRAGQARFQGGLQDAEMFYKTRMLGQQESDAAKARRVEVANRNRASMNTIDAAKKQIDAGRVTANYQQVIAPYLAGVENRFRQTKAMRDQLALESYLNEANSNYNTSTAKIMEDYKDDPIGAQRELSKLQKGLQSDMLKKRSSLISTPWLVQFSGKGSKLSYAERAMLQRAKDFNKRLSDDNKQFHKDIMESKREHNKMIANMSALTAALIKKGMQL